MPEKQDSIVNLSHLDHLSEDIYLDDKYYRIVHIYCEAPDYKLVADPDEGTSCVDDVARTAVVYLRYFELTGNDDARVKAEAMLRFILYMQKDDGLFYNFVVNNQLKINTWHYRSTAHQIEWWSCRAIWALGMGSKILAEANPEMAQACTESLYRIMPHVHKLLDTYPETRDYHGRTVPTWLVYSDAADATSEMMLGMVPFAKATGDAEVQELIPRFAEGIAMMRYGSMNVFPFGLHASTKDEWHKWGNSQTQALAAAGIISSARMEAEQFYSRILIEGYLHSIGFDQLHAIRYFERIAYGIRSVAVGLIRLFEVTGDKRYAIMGGLAATWFTGNNSVGQAMYDPATGRGYDGLIDDKTVNYNAGAESTIEAVYTMMEIEQHPEAFRWLYAAGDPLARVERDGNRYLYRIFRAGMQHTPIAVGVIMNLTQEKLLILENEELDKFLASVA